MFINQDMDFANSDIAERKVGQEHARYKVCKERVFREFFNMHCAYCSICLSSVFLPTPLQKIPSLSFSVFLLSHSNNYVKN